MANNNNNMTYNITPPDKLDVLIKLPASKSISNRALVISALAGTEKLPGNLSDCDDTEVIVKALKDKPDVVDIKAAGTAMRFLTAMFSTIPGEHVMTGTQRMKQRPIHVLVDALRRLGADIAYEEKEGFPPLRIKGRELDGGWLDIQGNVSSQFISALLMIGPKLKKGLNLKLDGDIISRPYVDLTLCTMRDFGADAEWTDTDMIEVKPQPYRPTEYFIESDWSAASYWYEMIALCRDPEAEVRLGGLTDGSLQGDSVVKYLFSMLGVKTVFGSRKRGVPTTVTLRKTGLVSARLDYDFINQPDLVQTFAVTCAMMNVPFHFTGLASLRIKETDRIEALKREMRKLGYVIDDGNGSELVWNGERCEPDMAAAINTYEDHRMAMAFAPAAIKTRKLLVNNPQVVTKSYPRFWDDIKKAGFCISEE